MQDWQDWTLASQAPSPAYYNELDPFCGRWLEGLVRAGRIPAGPVDCRTIHAVQADEVRAFRQVHLFAGIAGWPALQFAHGRDADSALAAAQDEVA